MIERLLRRAFVIARRYVNCVRLLGFAGLKVVANSLLGSHREVLVSVGGRMLTLRLNSTDLDTLLQIFWNREYEFELVNDPDVIVDAGANVGYASAYFSSRYPQARIFAIEPDQGNFAQLQKNAEGCDRIVPVEAALWCDDSALELVDVGEGSWGFRILSDGQTGSRATVPGITLPTLMTEYNLPRIGVLKVDIEGSEKELFEHSGDWIDAVDVIVAELHDKYRIGCNRAFYNATNGFSTEARLGENILMARDAFLRP